jgi:hypothetical protein
LGKGKSQDQQPKSVEPAALAEDMTSGLEGLDEFPVEGKQDEQVPF